MSALVWSVEGVLIGLWALVFLQFAPTPFHTFVTWAQLAVAGVTLVMQLVTASRMLPVAHAISEAYVCAMSGLFLVYVMVLLDPGHHANPKFFSLGMAGGFLPVDACVGVGWFSAVLVGGIGMALSERGRPSALMLHHYGYHMLIVPPSFLVFWLYNYDGTSASEPLSQTVQFLRQGARITHFIYTMLLVGVWGAFIVLQATGALLQQKNPPAFFQMSAVEGLRYGVSGLLKLLGRCACILIPLSAVFTAKTTSQTLLAWGLVAVGAANAFDWLQILDQLLGSKGAHIAPVETPPMEASLPRTFDPAALALRYHTPSDGWREKSV